MNQGKSLTTLLGSVVAMLVVAAGSSAPAVGANCPNDVLRGGLSAGLPDCRAYELVTPADTNGRLVGAINTFGTPPVNGRFPIELASPSRDSIVYFTYSSPLLSPGGGNGVVDIYEAERAASGWATVRRLSPPGSEAVIPIPGGVSADHRFASINVGSSLSAMSLGGDTDYLVNPDGSFELTGVGSLGSEPLAQTRWISSGGGHVIFSTGHAPLQSVWCFRQGSDCEVRRLEPSAPPSGTGAVYDRSADGSTRVVSLLPGEAPAAAGEEALYNGSSRDGSAVAFTIGSVLYVRVDNAKTLEMAGGEPNFAGLSDDGSELFYVVGGNIHSVDTTTGKDLQVNSSGDAQVANVSADGSHVYFVSVSQLDGGKGTAGQPNLYVWSGGTPEYVATVASSDLDGIPAMTNWTAYVTNPRGGEQQGPGASSTRTTPGGDVLVFESIARLTPYDNGGHTEIYRYDDRDRTLLCVSCNLAVEPARKDARLQNLVHTGAATVIHNVTDDGSRVFFETPEALVGGDTDGVNDIYEWRQKEDGGVAVDLISSGKSLVYPLPEGVEAPHVPTPNVLLSVTPKGKDVVFLSEDVLLPGAGEGGAQAIYNARVGGGFPAPVIAPTCAEESCRPAPAGTPSFLTPQSETVLGSGNVKPRKRSYCRSAKLKHKIKKHRRCGRKSKQPQSRRARTSTYEGEGQQAPPSPTAPTSPSTEPGSESQPSAAAVTALAGPFDEFGIESVSAGESTSAAGLHPDVTTNLTLNHFINEKNGTPESNARSEVVSVSLPPGLLGNVSAIPKCKTAELVAWANCPTDSQVGVTTILATLISGEAVEPIYNLEPPHPDEEVARFGFYAGIYPAFIDVKVRTSSDYGVTATVHSAPGLAALLGANTTFWGNPADPIHDKERLTAHEAALCSSGTACKAPEGKRSSGLPPTAFLTNPSACQSQSVGFAVKSYQLPGRVFSANAPLPPITNCSGLPFAPTFDAQPTNRTAGSPTGLKATLALPQASTEAVDSRGTATMREARVTLPEGMTIAAGAADGLQACSEVQVGYRKELAAACPDASKLGTATVTSPLLPEPLQGELFQRTPRPGHLFGLWLVIDELGLHVKLPGEIRPDLRTGQLTTVFSELPQVPVSEIAFNVWGGPRAPLKNPDSCGAYVTSYTFTPHSNDAAVAGQSQMMIDQGCGTGGFSPTLHAGASQPVAGAFSPFILDLTREDAEQNLGTVEITLPKGELAKLKGVGLCPDAAAPTGDCPAGSKIGSLTAVVGPGPLPLWLPQPGKLPTAVYLAGPYKGAPFSMVTAVPAQAGPFDLGVVSVRSALHVNPETAQATVESDPLPQFIEGVAAIYRKVHIAIDRPGFSLNPTNCKTLATTAKLTSVQGTVASPSARFQVDGCKALKFQPKLVLKLTGGTERGDYPALRATVEARKDDANIGRVSVALPHSEFLAQEHIVTICTRKQFAADKCPDGSVYGKAKAWTPLLAKPLEGPVYLRSSDNPLPDLVMSLKGEIDVALVGRIDSVNQGIRTTFDQVPDAPITRFVLKMRGGKKSLLTNSEDICRRKHRVAVKMRAQNGQIRNYQPLLASRGCR